MPQVDGQKFSHVTLANKSVSGASIRQNAGYYSYTNSIIREPHVGFGAENCLLLHSDSDFDNLTNSQVANPYFIDEANHDYRLSGISHAIDMCGNDTNSLSIDFEGNQMWGDPNFINDLSIRDAGADESYMGDVIFKNTFQ